MLAGVPTNFDTDLFQPYLRFLEERSGTTLDRDLLEAASELVDLQLARQMAAAVFGETAGLERAMCEERHPT